MIALMMPQLGHSSEARLLIDASTGKVLVSENATRPWFPASITKLMTTYTTLRAINDGRIGFDTLLTVSPVALAQEPSKMGFPVGTRVTLDNALKMMLVKSANDMAVVIAEGVGGSVDGFAAMMNADAQRLGMTQSHFVNPNGLPAENHVSSARDLAILARALITEFPEYGSYWKIPAIRYGKRVIHNYNSLLARYPGADGMKTGFICASGYNLVASATRNGHRLIAVVLGAYSSTARAQKAARLLESGFSSEGLSSLPEPLNTIEALMPVDVEPQNLHEEMCGRHRRKPPSEANDEEETNTATGSDTDNQSQNQNQTVLVSATAPAKFVLGPPIDKTPPIVVFTGPPDRPDPVVELIQPRKKKRNKANHSAARAGEQNLAPQQRPARPRKKPAKSAMLSDQ